MREHSNELEWFDSFQLPNAIKVQEKIKMDAARRTGGRSARKYTVGKKKAPHDFPLAPKIAFAEK
jgi:hypothetical protein